MPSRDKPTLVVNISPQLKRAFKAQCLLNGVSMTERLSQFILQDSSEMMRVLAKRQVRE